MKSLMRLIGHMNETWVLAGGLVALLVMVLAVIAVEVVIALAAVE